MWSDRYNYYQIKSDIAYSKNMHPVAAINLFLQTGHFVKTKNNELKNASHFPWINVALVNSKNGNFNDKETDFLTINLIAIVCAKGQEIDQGIYLSPLMQIARALNWKLYLEEDDEGNTEIEF